MSLVALTFSPSTWERRNRGISASSRPAGDAERPCLKNQQKSELGVSKSKVTILSDFSFNVTMII